MTEKEQRKITEQKVKMLHKAICSMLKNIGYNNELIDNVVEFIGNEPQIFVYGRDPENRNFLKWAIKENMKRNQKFLDMISQIETEHKLPLENPETPTD